MLETKLQIAAIMIVAICLIFLIAQILGGQPQPRHRRTDPACVHYTEAGWPRHYFNNRGRGKGCFTCVPPYRPNRNEPLGFLTPDPITRPHYCTTPGSASAYAEGTRWQCDTCAVIHRVEQVMDRNITQLEWVKQPLRAADLLDFKP